MFEGEFAEIDSGERRIHIKTVKLIVIQVVLEFVHLERQPLEVKMAVVCTDELRDQNDPSLEDTYRVGHRYDVAGLCTQVAALLLAKPDSVNSIPFLFRSGYTQAQRTARACDNDCYRDV